MSKLYYYLLQLLKNISLSLHYRFKDKQTTMEYPHASPVLPHTIFPKIDGYTYKKYTNIERVYIISFNSLGKAINTKIRV